MSDIRLHNKLHKANHHTLSSVGVVDSAEDPIASKDYPFIGDFYLNGALSASNGLSANGSSYFVNTSTNPTISIVNSTSAVGLAITKTGTGNGITCNAAISASSIIYASGGNSNQWNEATDDVLTNNTNWINSYTTLTSNSSNWNVGYLIGTQLTGVSSNWNSSYSTVLANSGQWNSVYTTIQTKSGFWKSLYDTSPSWNAMYSTVQMGSGNWNTAYTTVHNISSNWQSATNTVSTNSAFWESSYTSVNSNSGSWQSNYTTVNTKSAIWDSAYNTLCANSATWATPVGTVMAFATSAVPTGWLKCNGQTLLSSAYTDLFSKIGTTFGTGGAGTFNLPDLRGRFVRGWVDNLGTDSLKNRDMGRIFGSAQEDSFQGHWHYFTKRSASPEPITTSGFDMFGTTGAGNINLLTTNTYKNNGYNNPRFGFETRPVNIALLYCIKY